LDTISTETFEKIKAAAKEPEYEGVYVGDYGVKEDRVIFEVTDELIEKLRQRRNQAVAMDGRGDIINWYSTLKRICECGCYDNIKKLGE